MTVPIDPTMLAALLQSGPATSTAAAFPTMPVSAISQAPAQLAAQQSGGINNIGSALSSMGATPSTASAPTTGGLSGLGGMSKPSSFGDRLAKVNAETPQHHALVASNAQYVPLEAPRTNPYAPTAPSSLFDMLKSMYGA